MAFNSPRLALLPFIFQLPAAIFVRPAMLSHPQKRER
jgi:hypothetical protein